MFVVVPLRRVIPVVVIAGLLLATGLILRRLILAPSGSPASESSATAVIVPVFRPDEPAPTFTLTGLDGSEWTETSVQDGPLVLLFWATWCVECSDVIARVNLIHASPPLKDRARIAAVNVADPPDAVATAVAQYEWDGPILLDRDGSVALAFGIGYLPGIVIVDEYGIVRDRLFGPVAADVYEARLLSIVPPQNDEGNDL